MSTKCPRQYIFSGTCSTGDVQVANYNKGRGGGGGPCKYVSIPRDWDHTVKGSLLYSQSGPVTSLPTCAFFLVLLGHFVV